MASLGQRFVNERNEKSFNLIYNMPERVFTLMLIIIICEKRAEASFDQGPNDTIAAANQATYFNCSTSNSPIDPRDLIWAHYPVNGGGLRNYVYDDGRIMADYRDRFDVEVDLASGTCNLIVRRPDLRDAGRYECIDARDSVGVSAELTVHKPNLACTADKDLNELVGPTECERAIPQDEVELSCSVSYSGRNSPTVKWIKATHPTVPLETECFTNISYLTCNTTVKANLQEEGSVYHCLVATGNYTCSLQFENISYAFGTKSKLQIETYEEVTCVANASTRLPCSFKWYKDYTTLVSTESTLKLNDTGLYGCRAHCPIRTDICVVAALAIEFLKTEVQTASNNLLWLLLPLVLLLLIVPVAVIVVWKRKSRPREKSDRVADQKDNLLPVSATQGGKRIPEIIPLQDQENKDESNPKDAGESKVSAEQEFQSAISNASYIDKGMSGEIYGPLQYKGKQCAFERIMCSVDQHTPTVEGEMSKEAKICANGQKWMELNHERLLKFYDVVSQPPAVYIVMDYAEGGSIRKALNKCKECPLPLTVVKDWVIQIAEGMKYLHENDIIHKSLKCAQVLIMGPFDPLAAAQVTLKVASYSLTSETSTSNPVTFKGMFAWMAPETILDSKHTKCSDIWSYGVTVWEILTREIPYDKKKVGETVAGIINGDLSLQIPDFCPSDLQKIFEGCFNRNPEERPAFGKILSILHEMKLA